MNATRLLRALPTPLQTVVWLPARGVRAAWRRGDDAIARPHPAPVFMLGNQKSGTTAIAALLGRATGLPASLDLRRETRNDFWPRVTRGEVPFDRLLRRNGRDFSRPIVKEPNLTFFTAELRERFPSARFAFVLRDPRDNARSILDRVGLPGDLPALDGRHQAQVDPGFALVLDGRWLGIEAGPHYVDRLAERWNACLAVYEREAHAMALLRYEDFVADKPGAVERLARELDLSVRHDVSPHVDRQYQMRGRRGVDWRDFFGPNLARIERRCAAGMRRHGYAPSDAGTGS